MFDCRLHTPYCRHAIGRMEPADADLHFREIERLRAHYPD